MKIGFLFEHPQWSEALIGAFRAQGVDITAVNVAEVAFDTGGPPPAWDAAVNRVNIMPSAGRSPAVAFHTQHYLRWLEHSGIRVINGAGCHALGASKALQNTVFAALGVKHPRAIAIGRAEDALAAARAIGYPIIVKPNIGGSGSGVAFYPTADTLARAVQDDGLALGVDGTGVVQEYIAGDGYIYRVEVLGRSLFYSIRQPILHGTFNYCALDGCAGVMDNRNPDTAATGGDDEAGRIEAFTPSAAVVETVVAIIEACGADLGGVEFFLDGGSGRPCYYDFNPYSNFVRDRLLGFSAAERYVRFVIQMIEDR